MRIDDLNKAIARVQKIMRVDFKALSSVERLQLVSELSAMARKFGVSGEIDFGTLLGRLEELKEAQVSIMEKNKANHEVEELREVMRDYLRFSACDGKGA